MRGSAYACSCGTPARQHALMQAPDGIQRGQQCAFLPGRECARHVRRRARCGRRSRTGCRSAARAVSSVQWPAQPSVQGTRCQATATPCWNSLVYCGWICAPYSTVLRMRSSGGMAADLEGIGAEGIGAQQHARSVAEIVGARIADQGVGQVGEGDAAVDRLVLFPEAALELQADLDGRRRRTARRWRSSSARRHSSGSG